MLLCPNRQVPKAPRLKVPYANGPALLSPRTAVMLLPAGMVAMAFAAPGLLAKLLLQVICYFGSLIEPFDSLLPENGVLRAMVTTVKDAKRNWHKKMGIPYLEDTGFLDEDDEDEPPSAAGASEGSEGGEEAP